MYKQRIRQCFILLFYALVMTCLISWEVTSLAQMFDPDTNYLVYQLIDSPEHFHVSSNIA